jgi:uncharacterized membrane protein YgcG
VQISHSMHNTRKKKSCRRREHHHLSLLLMQKTGVAKDIAQLVFSFLDAHVLVRCSMVSKHMRQLVDVSHSNIFARDLLWWGSFEHASISTHYREAQQMSVSTWDEDLSQFSLFTCANSSSAQTLWMLNSCPATNTIIRMRLQVILPTANRQVMLSGESNQVDKVLKRGRASVDVMAWRIIEVIEGQTNATVRLSAVEFQHNTVRVSLSLTAPIVLQVENVPLQTWPYRCLWVMRGVRKCMNCKQRPRAVQRERQPRPQTRACPAAQTRAAPHSSCSPARRPQTRTIRSRLARYPRACRPGRREMQRLSLRTHSFGCDCHSRGSGGGGGGGVGVGGGGGSGGGGGL